VAPDWVVESLRRTPWVVVRRARAPAGRIAVGVRGPTRTQRHPLIIDPDDVMERVAPQQLTDVVPRRDLPAFRTLDVVRRAVGPTGLEWGPTGSVGFELATGHPCVRAGSDLDIAVFVDRLGAASGITPLPGVDCAIETPSGAVALAELVHGAEQVLLKTADGPRLVGRRAAVP
jgi:phosphoribosyl-dephospho-CoA transferase